MILESEIVEKIILWLQKCSRFLNFLRYEQKADLVNNISYSNQAYFQSLSRKWKDASSLYRVKGIQFSFQYLFLQSERTKWNVL